MIFVNVSVRDVDPKVFREFKVKTVEIGMKTGTAMTQALKEWAEKRENKKKKVKSFFDNFKSWDWGKGSEKSSIEIDEVLYGLKK
ncbi:MAG: hypothetical protein AABW85_02420 [archaeon]